MLNRLHLYYLLLLSYLAIVVLSRDSMAAATISGEIDLIDVPLLRRRPCVSQD